MRDFIAIAGDYARAVTGRKIPASKWTRLSCKRYLADLKRPAKSFPYHLNEKRATRACRFLELLPHVKGKWSGRPMVLEPWQVFTFVNLFGWVHRVTGLRRFRRAFILVPRKNGKTTIAAGVGLLMLTAEAEPGAEIYCGATSEDQANEVFRPAKAMAKGAEGFTETYGLTVAASSIFREDGLTFFQRLIGKPGEGQSPYCAIHDEYHEHPTSEQVDSMDTGMGARQEPLQLIITTAGTNISSPCKEFDDYARQVLEGVLQDEKLFVLVYATDPKDDWEDWTTWVKANPNLGVSVSEEYLRDKLKEAQQRVSKQNITRCKHLNEWMNAGSAWIDPGKWLRLAEPSLRLQDFEGKSCWMALDLASKIDICARVLLFQRGEGFVLFGRYYLPEETILLPQNQHYRTWVGEGWITQTDGARTDFRTIEEDVLEDSRRFAVQELDFDPREASYLIAQIQDQVSFECVEIAQGPAHMSEPMKEFEALVAAGQIHHNGDPVMAWMMSNVVVKTARGGGPVKYSYPTKDRADAKIDGPVAAIMALGAAKSGRTSQSRYEQPDAQVHTFGRLG